MATVAAIENFRENVRAIMDDRGISQTELATAIHSKQAYIARILTGKIDPSMGQCEKIAKAIDVPLTVLLAEPVEFLKIRA